MSWQAHCPHRHKPNRHCHRITSWKATTEPIASTRRWCSPLPNKTPTVSNSLIFFSTRHHPISTNWTDTGAPRFLTSETPLIPHCCSNPLIEGSTIISAYCSQKTLFHSDIKSDPYWCSFYKKILLKHDINVRRLCPSRLFSCLLCLTTLGLVHFCEW